MMSELCLCQSQKSYEVCCAPYHQGKNSPETAEQLMRSRYVAYVQGDITYIVQTTLPSQQLQLDQVAMRTWSEQTSWDGLEILQHREKVTKSHAQVEFKAYFKLNGERQNHHELSTFVKIQDRWFFLDPTLDNYPTMKQPCICGSTKKFKQCCAPFLPV